MDKLLNTKQIREVLNCSKTKLYEMINNGAFPVVQIGRRYYISEAKLQKWINTKTKIFN